MKPVPSQKWIQTMSRVTTIPIFHSSLGRPWGTLILKHQNRGTTPPFPQVAAANYQRIHPLGWQWGVGKARTTSRHDLASSGSGFSIQMVEPVQAEPWFMVISKEPCARVTPVTCFGEGSDSISLLGSYDLIIQESTKSGMLVYISTTHWLQFRISYKHGNEQSLNFLECFHQVDWKLEITDISEEHCACKSMVQQSKALCSPKC